MVFSWQEYWTELPFPSPTTVEVGHTAVQWLTPPTSHPRQLMSNSFYRWRAGATGRNSAVNSDNHLKLVITGLISVILIVVNTVNLQVQGTFVFISWVNSQNCVSFSHGFPGGSVVKNPPAKARDVGVLPGLGRSPGEGNGNPLQYSCLENPMDRGTWWATVHGVTKSQTPLKRLTHTHDPITIFLIVLGLFSVGLFLPSEVPLACVVKLEWWC